MTEALSPQAQALAEQHYPLVPQVVGYTLRTSRPPAHVDADDLTSIATVALVQSAHRYRPDAGTKFKNYAWRRMHGAILDEFRRDAPLSRHACRKWKAGEDFQPRYFESVDELRDRGFDLSAPSVDRDVFLEARLELALGTLPPRTAAMVTMYYLDEQPMGRIAARFGLCESRVSQVIASGLRLLRTALAVAETPLLEQWAHG